VNGTVISDMNTYDILNANVLVLTESAAKLFSMEEAEAEA
jgi:large subunit ribosomal protein L4